MSISVIDVIGLILVVGGFVRFLAPTWKKMWAVRILRAFGLKGLGDEVLKVSDWLVRGAGVALIIIGIVLTVRW